MELVISHSPWRGSVPLHRIIARFAHYDENRLN